MGYFDRVWGKRSGKEPAGADETHLSSEAAGSAPPAPSTPEIVHDAGPSGSGFGPPSINASSISPGSPALSAMSTGFTAGAGVGGGASPSQRLYDPYDGISQAVGMRKQVFKLPERPEFLFEEEAAVRRRGWGENLQFYTGLGYITGGGSGVAAGVYRFATTKSPIATGTETMKLKTNRMLNSVGMYARPLANGCGILGLLFSTTDSVIYNQLDKNGLPDSFSSVLAGAITGAVYRSPRGPRTALVAGALGAVAGSALVAVRQVFPSL